MKRYNIYDLYLVESSKNDNIYYLICKYNDFKDSYIEVLTDEKNISNKYYYDRTTFLLLFAI